MVDHGIQALVLIDHGLFSLTSLSEQADESSGAETPVAVAPLLMSHMLRRRCRPTMNGSAAAARAVRKFVFMPNPCCGASAPRERARSPVDSKCAGQMLKLTCHLRVDAASHLKVFLRWPRLSHTDEAAVQWAGNLSSKN